MTLAARVITRSEAASRIGIREDPSGGAPASGVVGTVRAPGVAMSRRFLRAYGLAASLGLAALLAGGCAPPTEEDAGESADAVNAADVLDGIPRNTWVRQGQSRGQHDDVTGIARWEVYVAFGAMAEPYIIALGKTPGKESPAVEVVIDTTNGEMDLRSGVAVAEAERAAWLDAIARDLQELRPSEGETDLGTREGPSATGKKECAIASAWAVLHAAGFAAAGALTVGACVAGVVSGPVTGGLVLAFCIWQAHDTVELSKETSRRIQTAYKACR